MKNLKVAIVGATGLVGRSFLKVLEEKIDIISKEKEEASDSIKVKDMLILAIATSIDALAIGITFAFLEVNITLAVSLIGIITFIISVIGVKVGNIFGDKYEKKAELAGGIILIGLGIKILIEHLLNL